MALGAQGPSRLPDEPGPTDAASDDGRFSAEHRLARSLPVPARYRGPRRLRLDKNLRRRLVVGAALVVVAALMVRFADAPNPDYPEAIGIQDRITTAWEAIVDGGAVPQDAAAAANLQVFTFETGDSPFHVLTHPVPTANGACYALRFGSGIVTRAGILREPGPGCTAQQLRMFQSSSGGWEDILPSERMTPWWFVPLMMVIVGYVIFLVVDLTIVLIARARLPSP